jgi:hypothetical protein
VVDVGVGEKNAADGSAESAGGGEDVVGGVGQVGVDEGEAVGLADEVAVDEAETGELVSVGGDRGGLHSFLDAPMTVYAGTTGWLIPLRRGSGRLSM